MKRNWNGHGLHAVTVNKRAVPRAGDRERRLGGELGAQRGGDIVNLKYVHIYVYNLPEKSKFELK